MDNLKEYFNYDLFNSQSSNMKDPDSLYTLAETFNRLYLSFVEDYKKFEKIDYGYRTEFFNYHELKRFTILELFVWNAKFPEYVKLGCYNGTVHIVKNSDNIYAYIDCENTSAKTVFADQLQSRVYLNIPEKKLKEYLNLFHKHKAFFDLYDALIYNRGFRFNQYSCTYFINNNWDINGSFGEFRFFINDDDNVIQIPFNIGENFGINYSECKCSICGKTKMISHEDYDKFAKSFIIEKSISRVRKER